MGSRKQNLVKKFLLSDVDPRYFAALRILIGLCLFSRICHLGNFAVYHFSDAGWLPSSSTFFDSAPLRWSLLKWVTGEEEVKLFFVAAAIFSLSLALGFFSRISLVLSYIFFVSICNRNISLAYGGDEVAVVILYFLFFSPLGQKWSIDSSLSKKTENNFSFQWLLLLIQIQLCLVYFCSGWGKLHGTSWVEGKAIEMVLANPQFGRFNLSLFLQNAGIITLLRVFTWATLIFEISFPILVAFRSTRALALIFGFFLHLGIAIFMEVGNFSVIMLSTYVVFLPPQYFDQVEIFLKRIARSWANLWRQIVIARG